MIKAAIVWYLRRKCGGAFHWGEYGPDGHYIARLTEDQYHEAMKTRDAHHAAQEGEADA